jgi:putative transposase
MITKTEAVELSTKVKDLNTFVRKLHKKSEGSRLKGLAQGILAKQVHDAGWSQFITLLKYKAESAGRRVVEVDARYTSQECPACGTRKKKSLSERTHECSECGLVLHRDTAAAQVILARMEPLGAKIGEPIPCLV